ncbi:MAG: hypothetical protein M1817_006805 [Caeruleum heppii]|nr:MAG: hypothetical protein M1817_006805 [Caeruleum heppii]
MRSFTSKALSLSSLASLVTAQGLSSIPPCYQDCIENSGSFTCNGIDIPCICRLSNGNFLPNVITCIRANCDNNLDTSNLLGPLELGCNLVGVPIAPAAIANAENLGQSPSPITRTGRTTIQSTVASAGTTFVVAIPISIASGRSGFSTSTGSPRTAVANIITVPARPTATRGSGGGVAGGDDGDSTDTADEGSSGETGGTELPTETGTEQSADATDTTGGGGAADSSPTDTATDASTLSPSETSIPTPTGTAGAAESGSDAASSASESADSQASEAAASATAIATGNGSPFSASSDGLWVRPDGWMTIGVFAVVCIFWL